MSDRYVAYMQDQDAAPPEIRDDPVNAGNLKAEAQRLLPESVT